MTHKRLLIAAAIIAIIVIAGFAISVPHTVRDLAHAPAEEKTAATIPVVSLKDSYKKGVHTITGSFVTPNACSVLTADATLEGMASTSQSILIALTVATDEGICLELPTTKKFSTTITAPSGLDVSATVNGVVASTTSS